jgi:outer membrane immunogenic protein
MSPRVTLEAEMKSSLLAGVSLIAFAAGAQAADLPRSVYKAPALAPAVWNWTGFYVGANIGAVRTRSTISDDPASFFPWLQNVPTENSKTSLIGGIQAGYNWQFSSLVAGVEGDISFGSRNNTVDVIGLVGIDTYSTQLKWLGTLRGRVGWAFERALIYGTGGVAFANHKNELQDSIFPFSSSPSSSVTGWALGGGVEYAIANNWTVKAEYLHISFPDRTAPDSFGNGYVFRFSDKLDIGRVGINYKF